MKTLPDPIGSAVQKELDRFGPAGRMGELVAAWPSAVGPAIATNAWPARIARDGTLHVTTGSAAWAFELTQLSRSVLTRLWEQLGEGWPTDISFAVGPLPEVGADAEKHVNRIVPKPSTAHEQEAERIAAPICDSELREAAARAIAASLAGAEAPPDDRSV
jgi:hypothetical protein